MSWIFLGAALVCALFTLNAYFPTRRPAELGAISFFLGWPTTELAAHHVVWEIAATALFIRAGALAAWPGWLGLAIAIGNWIALLADYQSGWKTRDVFKQALDKGLGADWRKRLRPELREKIRRVALRQLLFPLPMMHPEVVRISNVTFYEEPKFKLRLDVYRHKSRPKNAPTLIYVHGGAWVIGDKGSQGIPMLQHMAALGWTCFGINYRLSPRATFPDHLIDVKRAIAWVREHSAEYGADPNFVIISGGSAGGHLCALATVTAGQKQYQPGFESADTSVQGCVPLYGIFDFVDRAKVWPHLGLTKMVAKHVLKVRITADPGAWDRASPMFWINASLPPFLLIHGTRDTMVPIEESRNFAAALRATIKSHVALAEVPGAQHAYEIFPSPRAVCTVEGIADFSMLLYSEYLDKQGKQLSDKPIGERPATAVLAASPASV